MENRPNSLSHVPKPDTEDIWWAISRVLLAMNQLKLFQSHEGKSEADKKRRAELIDKNYARMIYAGKICCPSVIFMGDREEYAKALSLELFDMGVSLATDKPLL